MKVALINGSPRGEKAGSLSILNGLKGYLTSDDLIETKDFMWNLPSSRVEDFEELLEYDAIVFSFPLYIDSIPSHLLRNLVSFQEYVKSEGSKSVKEINIYVIINNGFFQGKQNILALDSMRHFCNRVGFRFKQGIGVGGGGMISGLENVPFGKGPKKGIGDELSNMAVNIKGGNGYENRFVEPNIPQFVYKFMAEVGWRSNIRKNGLKLKDINRTL